MATLTHAQVYALARRVGLGHDQAVTAAAIASAESDRRTDAFGDMSLTDAKWGPSVGLWQIRSLNAETGTGRTRDRNQLTDPVQNARAMFDVSGGGRDWSPWSVYKSGEYRSELADVQRAAGGGSTLSPDSWSQTYPGGGTQLVSVSNDSRNPFDVDVSLGPLSGPVEGLIEAAGPIIIGGLFVAGGAALVVAGLWAASS